MLYQIDQTNSQPNLPRRILENGFSGERLAENQASHCHCHGDHWHHYTGNDGKNP